MTVKKFYFSFSILAEQKWLNNLGKQGYALVSQNSGKYVFDVRPDHCYSYGIEWLDASPLCEESVEYLTKRQESTGDVAVATRSCYVYLIHEDDILTVDTHTKKLTANHFRNIFIFFLIAAIIVSGIVVYNIIRTPEICAYYEAKGESEKFAFNEPEYEKLISESGAIAIIAKVINRIVYGFRKIIYAYASLWTGVFGAYRSTKLLSVLMPIFALFLGIAIYNLVMFLYIKPKHQKSVPISEVIQDAEQTIQG